MKTLDPVDEAARLSEIDFPGFTTKLILDVFDGLVASQLRQQEAYAELLQDVSKTLEEYINATQDDIPGEQILQVLSRVFLPVGGTGDPQDDGDGQQAEEPQALQLVEHTPTAEEVEALAEQFGKETTGDAGSKSVSLDAGGEMVAITEGGALSSDAVDLLMTAVARRLAANRYDLLQNMVQQGMLRLVVERGEIETRMTFNATRSTYYSRYASHYDRRDFNFRAKASTGKALSKWIKASAAVDYSRVRVSTASEAQRDVSGTSVNIFGGVKVWFKSDYRPLGS